MKARPVKKIRVGRLDSIILKRNHIKVIDTSKIVKDDIKRNRRKIIPR